ncbi:uncharacterized protein [Nicotiana tomentosiformis]|uniref:uncharacterized protein n=1 Tax=Nicotiana tomentosiformis TaxID=4098 RepID=UPI00388CBFA6
MIKYPYDEVSAYACFKLEVVRELAEKYKLEKMVGDSLERCITQSSTTEDENPEIKKESEALEDDNQVVDKEEFEMEMTKPKLELKVLPTHLKYAFLVTNNFLVIVSADLTGYNHIPIAPEDVEKTTFTCPSRIFEYRRMIFDFAMRQLHFKGFYKKFIKNFSSITKPLMGLLAKDMNFVFDVECLRAFELIKEKLVSIPIMVNPDWSEPFEIMCDVSDVAVGVVLGQRRDKIFRPIYYASHTLNDAQVNFATTEKEFFVVVLAFDKLRSYLVGEKSDSAY